MEEIAKSENKNYLTSQELEELFCRLKKINEEMPKPSHDQFMALLDKTTLILEAEDVSYRPCADDRKSGGLLDFTSLPYSNLPIIIVPDLHARSYFLINLLNKKININSVQKSVLQALNEKELIVVCVGDGVHAESRAYERWLNAYKEWLGGVYDSEPMVEEMKENISTMSIVMELKCAFTSHFHFLKGNHENILDEEGHGNHSFRKFALEGEMVLDYMREVYSDAVVHLINCFEKSLPVCVMAKNCFISHAEPAYALKKKDIINYHENPQVILALTWTANDSAENESVKKTSVNLNSKAKNKKILWFGGHRPVNEKYMLRQQGLYVQIHNPDEENVALVYPDKDFDFNKDIICVEM